MDRIILQGVLVNIFMNLGSPVDCDLKIHVSVHVYVCICANTLCLTAMADLFINSES